MYITIIDNRMVTCMKNKKNLYLVIVIVAFLGITAMSCGNKNKQTTNELQDFNEITKSTDGVETTEDIEYVIDFTDFTVERCVRKFLGKEWDEAITNKDLEKVTSLCITSVYDPTFGISYSSNLSTDFWYKYIGYVDLCDLRYLKNLEELKIDTFMCSDSIVNLEMIAECKSLKKISIPCCTRESDDTIYMLGYKYWADIIAELPELEYLDLGMYFDEHMKSIVLSKTDNKDIEFYTGTKGKWIKDDIETYYYQNYSANYYFSSSLAVDYREYVPEITIYEDAWDYEYKTIAERIDKKISFDQKEYIFPVIYVYGMDGLEYELEKLNKDVEDIIIYYDGTDKLDFSVFNKFKDLVTLTIIGDDYEQEKYLEKDNITIVEGEYVGISALNLKSLARNENLQVLNLRGFVGGLSYVTNIKSLRELSIVDSVIESVDFIGELITIEELVLRLNTYDNEEEFFRKLDREISSLNELRYYNDQNVYPDNNMYLYENICDMKSLDTLICSDKGCIRNIVQSETLVNLYAKYVKTEELSFSKMSNLELLVVSSFDNGAKNIDYLSIVNLPKIKSVAFLGPFVNDDSHKNVLTSDLADRIVNNDSISAFKSDAYYVQDYLKIDQEYVKKLYDVGVDEGICQEYLRWFWGRFGYEIDFEEYLEMKER